MNGLDIDMYAGYYNIIQYYTLFLNVFHRTTTTTRNRQQWPLSSCLSNFTLVFLDQFDCHGKTQDSTVVGVCVEYGLHESNSEN